MSNPSTRAGVRCMLMRGGTSKGAYFLREDLPEDVAERDELLLRIMGSPDLRQIDGIGGAHPLTSKVAVVSEAADDDADVEYLFLQVSVDEALVSDRQNCGNLLAGVAPFAIERGIIRPDPAADDATVRIRMLNTDSIAVATVVVADGRPVYHGDTSISGVPGAGAPIQLDFEGTAGGSTGALLPTGNVSDVIAGVECTLIDNGMPVVVMRAEDVGVTGYESCTELETNDALRATLEEIRSIAGHLMQLGDVSDTTVPKLTMVSPARQGGTVSTRTFIPHRCHDAIGVLGAVSVATAIKLPGSPAASVAVGVDSPQAILEHPTGAFETAIEVQEVDEGFVVSRSGIVRTARMLMDGTVYPR